MLKKLLTLVLLLFSTTTFAQLSSNMYLFGKWNGRPGQPPSQFNSIYAAIWGYTAPDNREYAILGCVTGTSFIDITDSNNITEVGFIPGPYSAWREMKTYSHYAYIVTDATNPPNSGIGLQIVDLQYLPDSVSFVKNWTYAGFTQAHTISIEGSFLYLNGGNASSNGGISIIDISNPIEPVRLGSYTSRYVHDSFIRGDTIYAATMFSNRFTIINASNKNSPTVYSEFSNLPNYSLTHNTWVTDDRRFMLTTDEGQSPPGALKIWNIENLSNIQFVVQWRPPGNSVVHNVVIKDTLAYVSHYEEGIRVLNISNPEQPQEIAYYDTYPASNTNNYRGNWGNYPFFASGKIISSDMQTGLYVTKIGEEKTSITSNNEIVSDYYLSQNYPNPFNPVTRINFAIPKQGFVSLKLYDVAGREVKTLVNKALSAGSYNYELDMNDFTSGVYFYELTSGEFRDVKRLVLIK